ncbi:hypothetical protein KDA_27620 [Dictyobacter alpinus]|uniref:Uncharacterized protein n=1 Tax=Dictyobacter alpinus TaxID=2014873 RepID=A0A402B7F5_9CHLR|nr:hypothetical protein [Dictyobacter alpinus]GCE27278.1 hypothetical protein KDA_27620 [Dictyobacter alpinus]
MSKQFKIAAITLVVTAVALGVFAFFWGQSLRASSSPTPATTQSAPVTSPAAPTLPATPATGKNQAQPAQQPQQQAAPAQPAQQAQQPQPAAPAQKPQCTCTQKAVPTPPVVVSAHPKHW